MTFKVAIYARYSDENQNPRSVEDQIHICRAFAEKQGWQVTHIFSDHAISGESLMTRPGVQSLLAAIRECAFDVLVAESLDRLSRSQEGAPHIFLRAKHAQIKIHTLEEGVITELHIGFKGTMGALQLQQIAAKTHRGQSGQVRRGKSAGGNCYGYDVVRKFDDDGEPVRGDRSINRPEAAIITRIFCEYVAGDSPKKIAHRLNEEGVPGPLGST